MNVIKGLLTGIAKVTNYINTCSQVFNMKSRAIKDLNQLSDTELVIQVSEGLELIVDHFLSVEKDARYLAEQNQQ